MTHMEVLHLTVEQQLGSRSVVLPLLLLFHVGEPVCWSEAIADVAVAPSNAFGQSLEKAVQYWSA